jgi:hypothetical protein
MRSNRGQYAFEFLMSYGWVLLIALVVLSTLLYYGIFEFNFLPDTCILGVGFVCQSSRFSHYGIRGIVDMKVTNAMPKDLVDFFVVIDPANNYCGGWMAMIASSGIAKGGKITDPSYPIDLDNSFGGAPFFRGTTRTIYNLLLNSTTNPVTGQITFHENLEKWRNGIFCFCPATQKVYPPGACTGTGPLYHVYNCCASDFLSKNVFAPMNGLCPGYNLPLSSPPFTCPRGSNMQNLRRFKSNIWVFYREKGSVIMHKRIGYLNLYNNGQWVSYFD